MYKKRLVVLIVSILLLTGCTKITDNLDQIVDTIMAKDNNYVNTVSTGYELCLPIGVKQVVDNEYNQQFKIGNRYIYLYVDTVSYYYKNMLNYKSEDSYNYYYRELSLNDKTGYIGIDKKEDDLYFTEIVYNYSKIEFYATRDELPFILANALIIQRSIKYNDNLIDLELANNVNDGREIKYELDGPKDNQSTFSDVLHEYVPEETSEVELPDDINWERCNYEING